MLGCSPNGCHYQTWGRGRAMAFSWLGSSFRPVPPPPQPHLSCFQKVSEGWRKVGCRLPLSSAGATPTAGLGKQEEDQSCPQAQRAKVWREQPLAKPVGTPRGRTNGCRFGAIHPAWRGNYCPNALPQFPSCYTQEVSILSSQAVWEPHEGQREPRFAEKKQQLLIWGWAAQRPGKATLRRGFYPSSKMVLPREDARLQSGCLCAPGVWARGSSLNSG